MFLDEEIDRRRWSSSRYGLYRETEMSIGRACIRYPFRCCPIHTTIMTFLIQSRRFLWRVPAGSAADHVQQDSRRRLFLISLCRLLRQAHGGIKLRGWKPSLYTSDVLPFIQKLLDDRLCIMGVESCLALIALEHVEHVSVVLVLLSC